MAYAAAAPVVTDLGTTGGRQHWLVTIVETGVTGSSDEWSFTLASAGLPRVCLVRSVSCIAAGGATVDPEAGMVASGTDVYSNGSAAAAVYFVPTVGQIWPHSGTLFGQSNANGATTLITTKLLIAEGSP